MNFRKKEKKRENRATLSSPWSCERKLL